MPAKKSEIHKESTTGKAFDFFKNQTTVQKQSNPSGSPRATTEKAKTDFAQDAVQQNMKQSKSFWAEQESVRKAEDAKSAAMKKVPSPTKDTPKKAPKAPSVTPVASTRPAAFAQPSSPTDQSVEKESVVKNAFSKFHSGGVQEAESNRQTTEQAKQHLAADEVKANWKSKTEFWQQKDLLEQEMKKKKAELTAAVQGSPAAKEVAEELEKLEKEVETMEQQAPLFASTEDVVKVEEDVEEEDDDVPDLEAVEQSAVPVADMLKGKQTRNEKKSRKAMQKLGMKPVPGCLRVTLRKSRSILFTITNPDVYKSPTADTYIIFGEAKIEDTAAEMGKKAMEVFKPQASAEAGAVEADDEDGDEPDASGLDPKDIELVMSQAQASRAKAVRALANNQGDIVNAIMELTM
uniref:NAC-A/B domain-containing protein n=1 Tax=Eutreptiella gymnastica TaxID=73025 RepID=A0A7S1N628_9EUGL